MADQAKILIAYDGSTAARAAIAAAARLFGRGTAATLLYVLIPVPLYAEAMPIAGRVLVEDLETRDGRAARQVVDEGLEEARAHGLVAEGRVERAAMSA